MQYKSNLPGGLQLPKADTTGTSYVYISDKQLMTWKSDKGCFIQSGDGCMSITPQQYAQLILCPMFEIRSLSDLRELITPYSRIQSSVRNTSDYVHERGYWLFANWKMERQREDPTHFVLRYAPDEIRHYKNVDTAWSRQEYKLDLSECIPEIPDRFLMHTFGDRNIKYTVVARTDEPHSHDVKFELTHGVFNASREKFNLYIGKNIYAGEWDSEDKIAYLDPDQRHHFVGDALPYEHIDEITQWFISKGVTIKFEKEGRRGSIKFKLSDYNGFIEAFS